MGYVSCVGRSGKVTKPFLSKCRLFTNEPKARRELFPPVSVQNDIKSNNNNMPNLTNANQNPDSKTTNCRDYAPNTNIPKKNRPAQELEEWQQTFRSYVAQGRYNDANMFLRSQLKSEPVYWMYSRYFFLLHF